MKNILTSIKEYFHKKPGVMIWAEYAGGRYEMLTWFLDNFEIHELETMKFYISSEYRYQLGIVFNDRHDYLYFLLCFDDNLDFNIYREEEKYIKKVSGIERCGSDIFKIIEDIKRKEEGEGIQWD